MVDRPEGEEELLEMLLGVAAAIVGEGGAKSRRVFST